MDTPGAGSIEKSVMPRYGDTRTVDGKEFPGGVNKIIQHYEECDCPDCPSKGHWRHRGEGWAEYCDDPIDFAALLERDAVRVHKRYRFVSDDEVLDVIDEAVALAGKEDKRVFVLSPIGGWAHACLLRKAFHSPHRMISSRDSGGFIVDYDDGVINFIPNFRHAYLVGYTNIDVVLVLDASSMRQYDFYRLNPHVRKSGSQIWLHVNTPTKEIEEDA